jgi:hypothetical protein
MGSIRKFGVALVVAGVMAGALGTTLEAADKKPRPDPNDAICAYLRAIIEHPGVNETVLRYVLGLYAKYGCAAR